VVDVNRLTIINAKLMLRNNLWMCS